MSHHLLARGAVPGGRRLHQLDQALYQGPVNNIPLLVFIGILILLGLVFFGPADRDKDP